MKSCAQTSLDNIFLKYLILIFALIRDHYLILSRVKRAKAL